MSLNEQEFVSIFLAECFPLYNFRDTNTEKGNTQNEAQLNPTELEKARVQRGISEAAIANVISLPAKSYQKKERGESGFTLDEVLALAKFMDLNEQEFASIFFNGVLPFLQPADKKNAIRKHREQGQNKLHRANGGTHST